MVSIITCTMRPSYIENIFSNYKRQKLKKKELIIVLNRDDIDISVWKRKAKKYKNIFVYQVPEEYTLGRCINFAIEKTHYDIVAKFDDDDYYAPRYMDEALNALETTDASIVGKSAAFIYFEENKALMIFRSRNENSFQRQIKGGTLVFRKKVWEEVKFADQAVGSDSIFLKESLKRGFKIYSVSKYNYVCIRRQDVNTHTQKDSTEKYMTKCKLVCHTNEFISIITKTIKYNDLI